MKVNDMKARLLNLEETFKKHESELTELDRAIGDGDHGVNMVRGFSSLKDKLDDSSMQSLFKSTGMALMSNVAVHQDHCMALALLKCLQSPKMIWIIKILLN